jgi:hypothetical protein
MELRLPRLRRGSPCQADLASGACLCVCSEGWQRVRRCFAVTDNVYTDCAASESQTGVCLTVVFAFVIDTNSLKPCFIRTVICH